MDPWSNEMIRSLASVALLLVLLTWESFAPYFAFFLGATSDRIQHGLRNLALLRTPVRQLHTPRRRETRQDSG